MRFVWSERSTWLPLLNATPSGRLTPKPILKILHERYLEIIVFHAARPLNIDAYYRDGLNLADHDELTARARKIFLTKEFPEVDEAAFLAAAQSLPKSDNKKVYACLDERIFQNYYNDHYLVYGSEFIQGIAVSLSRNNIRDYRQALLRIGKPTIFTLSVPIKMISEAYLIEFATAVKEHIREVKRGEQASQLDFTFTFNMKLPCKCVLNHKHPKNVRIPPMWAP